MIDFQKKRNETPEKRKEKRETTDNKSTANKRQ